MGRGGEKGGEGRQGRAGKVRLQIPGSATAEMCSLEGSKSCSGIKKLWRLD